MLRRASILISWLAILVCGCSKQPDPERRAAAEKVLNVYNWADFMSPKVVADFSKEYGIRVNYDVYDSEEVRETKLLTGHSNYDIVVPSGTYLEREIPIGVYRKLDKSKISNLKNIDADAQRALAVYDPNNNYGAGYTWFTILGIGFDEQKIRSRVPDAPVNNWRLFFNPSVLARLSDCGVALIDSPADILTVALIYLGRNPNSEDPTDLHDVEALLTAIRPYVRYIDTSRYDADLANGTICLALGWSGDIARAILRAKEANSKAGLAFSVPAEGSINVFDVLAIPADAPHPENAQLFINYLLRPEVAAINTNTTLYASVVTAAEAYIDPAIAHNPAIYPRREIRPKLVVERPRSQAFTRLLMRTWTRFKTNQ